MYKAYTANELKPLVGLPNDYKIKSFVSYGAWDDDKHFTNIQKCLRELGIEFTTQKLPGFLSHVLEIKIKTDVYWFAVVYGGTLFSEYLHLACLFGSDKNIHIGSCGGLYPEMNSLDLLIPTWSYGPETSASSYDRDNKTLKYNSDPNFSNKIKSLVDKKYKVWEGPVISHQAMLGETMEDVQRWSKEGYYGVEMETATAFSVSKHFNIPCASIVYVGDNLIKGQTVGDDSHVQQKSEREKVKTDVYKIALRGILEN